MKFKISVSTLRLPQFIWSDFHPYRFFFFLLLLCNNSKIQRFFLFYFILFYRLGLTRVEGNRGLQILIVFFTISIQHRRGPLRHFIRQTFFFQ